MGSLIVAVVDLASGLPIAGLTVTVGGVDVTTNQNGVAAFTSVPAGTITVTAQGPGYQAGSVDVVIAAGAQNTITLPLSQVAGGGGGGGGTSSGGGGALLLLLLIGAAAAYYIAEEADAGASAPVRTFS